MSTKDIKEGLRAGRGSTAWLDGTEELLLLIAGLEATVTELGRGIDELKLDLFKGGTRNLGTEGLSKGDHSLLAPKTEPLTMTKSSLTIP